MKITTLTLILLAIPTLIVLNPSIIKADYSNSYFCDNNPSTCYPVFESKITDLSPPPATPLIAIVNTQICPGDKPTDVCLLASVYSIQTP